MTATVRAHVEIAAPPEAVWAVLADPHRLPEWNGEVVAIEDATGPADRVGAAFTQVTRAPGRVLRGRLEVVEAEPPLRRVTEADLPMVAKAVAREQLTPTAVGTALELELEFSLTGGALGRLAERGLAGTIERSLAVNGENLRRLVEREAAA